MVTTTSSEALDGLGLQPKYGRHKLKIARIYLRVSTDEQDLLRQDAVINQAKEAGFYIACVYREKASGARPDRPELLRMISDLQAGDTVIAEKIDRISRLPLPEAEQLIQSITDKGVRLAIPDLVDFTELANESNGASKIVLEAMQTMLLRLALHMARDNYETLRERQRQGIALAKANQKYCGRKANNANHEKIIALRSQGISIAKTANLAGCSVSQVKRIWAIHQQKTIR